MTNWHPTEDDLILHFYGEGWENEGRVDDHVHACPQCQEVWDDLTETLKMVDAAQVPEPDSGFERVMWARVSRELPDRRPAAVWSVRQWLPVTGLAAAVIAIIGVGYMSWARPVVTTPELPKQGAVTTRTPPTDPAAANARSRERVLLTALSSHFQQTEMLLVEVLNAPASANEFAFERTSADDLVSSGRLYRVTAEQNGDRHLAQMLEDIERVLVDIARSPNKPGANEMKNLRTRIDNNGLLFKVRAVTNEIRQRQQTLNSASTN